MIEVYVFSSTGHCRRVAEYCASKLNTTPIAISPNTPPGHAETVLVVFPVYCQNIPMPVVQFLRNCRARYAAWIAVYGGISFGRVLYDAQYLFQGTTIAGAYLPVGHSYLSDPHLCDLHVLDPLLAKLTHPSPVTIPKTPKHIFADFAPRLRSRIGVKLLRAASCNNCDRCGISCPMHAMHNGKPDRNCIRCLHCVSICPQKSLSFRLHPLMRRYLQKKPSQSPILYL